MDEIITGILIIGGLLSAFLILPIVILVKVCGIKRELHELKDEVGRAPSPAPESKVEPEPVKSLHPIVEIAPVAPPPLPKMEPPKKAPPVENVIIQKSEVLIKDTAAKMETVVKKSKFAESVSEVFSKIWNWILVGEEHRTPGVSSEYAVASTWLLRVGILAIVMCAVYFLKWSMERNIISDFGRVTITIMAGVGMLIAGIKLLGKKYHMIGQGLLGGGILVLYFSVYAASPMMYNLISVPPAFGLIILVTATAGFLSVRTDSMLIAIIGIAGGFLTPALLKTPDPNLYAYYTYMLILNLGVLGIAHYKQWRLLNYISFALTYILFIGTLFGSYDKERHFTVAIGMLALLFVVHSSLVYMYNILKAKGSSILEIIHLVANAALFSCTAYFLIEGRYGRPYPAIMSMGLAVFFILHVLVFLKKNLVDRNLLIALIALAGIFTAWTLPLVFERESLTISLSLFALMLFWISRKLESNFMQNLSYLAYAVVFVRLLSVDMPRNFDMKPAQETTMAVYWKGMAQRLWTFGSSIASVIVAFFMQRGRLKVAASALDRKNDVAVVVKKNTATQAFYWCAVLFVFLFLHLELNTMFSYYTPFRLPMLTILWCGMAGYFLWKYISESGRDSLMLHVMSIFLVLVFLKIFVFDLTSWHFCDRLIYNMEYTALYAGMRFIDFASVIGILFVAWWVMMGRGDQKTISRGFGYGGLLLFFVYMSLEANSLLHWKHQEFQAGGISVLWALFAISFISGGLWKSVKPLRYIGLILFVIVVAKVFLLDLKDMEMIYRVIAFMVLGVTLLLGSFAYIKGDSGALLDK